MLKNIPQLSTKGKVNMNFQTDVVFRHAPRTESVAEFIRKSAAKLSHFCDHITHCRVIVDKTHHHHRKGVGYRVRICLSIPGRAINIEHDTFEIDTRENMYAALNAAFESARHQLVNYAGRQISRNRRPHVPSKPENADFQTDTGLDR
jgi:ribosome-associated translation inhibitor RaiA